MVFSYLLQDMKQTDNVLLFCDLLFNHVGNHLLSIFVSRMKVCESKFLYCQIFVIWNLGICFYLISWRCAPAFKFYYIFLLFLVFIVVFDQSLILILESVINSCCNFERSIKNKVISRSFWRAANKIFQSIFKMAKKK